MLDPHGLLAHVHPDLVKVMQHASQAHPFQIVYGLRTLTAEEEAVATGHSTTMHSRHLANKNGLACAVDVCALNPDGTLNWAKGQELKVFGDLAVNIKFAAAILKIPVEWGGDWRNFKDFGHFQLPWAQYP